MPTTRNYQRSFAGGEVSPEMFGRIDDVRYQTGAATVRNFITKPQGPAENRPGFQLVREVKDSSKKTRLIPFTFSVEQTYVIELGEGYFRIHSDGGTLLWDGDPFFAEGEVNPGELLITASDDSPDLLLTAADHGLEDGDPIIIWAGTYASSTAVHYVIDATSSTFKVSLTEGGSPVAYNAGSLPAKASFLYYEHDTVTFSGRVYYKNGSYPGSQEYWSSNQGIPSTATSYWVDKGLIGTQIYESVAPYTEDELFEVNYVQSNDVLTLVHQNHPPAEIRRYGASKWLYEEINFTPPLAKPTPPLITPSRGRRVQVYRATFALISGTRYSFRLESAQQGFRSFNWGDPIYIEGLKFQTGSPFAGEYVLADGFYQVLEVFGTNNDYMYVAEYEEGSPARFDNGSNFPAGTGPHDVEGYIQYSEKSPDIDISYKVTAIGSDDIAESEPSDETTVTNNIYSSGAYNTLSWGSVIGAVRYNIYKEQNGLYGYIGQTEGTEFVDDNIAPDMAISPPTYDDTLTTAGNYPGAVSYFEQRRVFAGTVNEPQSIWMTKSGTESDFSYQLPTRDDDRISFKVAAREANRIQHIVPMTDLLMMTNAAEWRITSVNSDALTPSSIAIRPQSFIGASSVQPSVVNNSMVYCAARGGHVRELGYSDAVNGFVTNDVSLRAAHLFDNLTLTDQTYAKSPLPIVWFVSSNGKLLGLTYIPEQQIGAWHQHDTQDGFFESVCAVPEGDDDRLYVVVRRLHKGTGTYKRYVERMAVRNFDALSDVFFVDSGLSYDGTNTSATTMQVTGGSTWGPGEDLTLQASTSTFVAGDVGDVIELDAPDGTIYRLTITVYTDATTVTVQTDKVIPAPMRGPLTTWAFCRNEFAGLDHLENYSVAILADGAVQARQTVDSGKVTLSRAFRKAHIGIPIQSDLKTLPMVLQIDGFGQGRHKNVNRVWLRVFRSSSIFAGPNESQLTQYKQRTSEPYGSPPALLSEQVEILVSPSWNEDGQILVRQDDPLPLTVSGLTIQVALGG